MASHSGTEFVTICLPNPLPRLSTNFNFADLYPSIEKSLTAWQLSMFHALVLRVIRYYSSKAFLAKRERRAVLPVA